MSKDAPYGDDQPFIDYIDAVDQELERRFGITSHQGQMDAIAGAQEDGLSPNECVASLTAESGQASRLLEKYDMADRTPRDTDRAKSEDDASSYE